MVLSLTHFLTVPKLDVNPEPKFDFGFGQYHACGRDGLSARKSCHPTPPSEHTFRFVPNVAGTDP
jgi:hypothetical protein